MSLRNERVRKTLMKEIADIISKDLRDPRISGIVKADNGKMNYAMSILKSANGNPDCCERYTFSYIKNI